ncbi:TDX protein, partial [Atractosteus spatula]|nr:TDX protein [Atractosteus spatula]
MSSGNAKIGKPAPHFQATAVVDGQFKEIKLSDYRGKYVVFFFYPLDFTFVCPTEIVAFSDRAEEFRKINCEVIAASTDSQFSHLAWTNTPRKVGGLGAMKIPLVADLTQSISQDYGVLKEDEGIAYRSVRLPAGIGPQYEAQSHMPQPELMLVFPRVAVCPAGWKPGSDTIVPDVQKSKEYFAKKE